jgi:hypothetical protein
MKTHFGRSVCLVLLGMSTLVASSRGQAAQRPAQVVRGDSVTITAEVLSYDPDTRELSLKGPLGGLIIAYVSTDVQDVSALKPGAMVSATYYQAIAASVRRHGEREPLVGAADAAAKFEPGMPVKASKAVTESLTVSSVDLPSKTVVFLDKKGKVVTRTVERSEFQERLKDLKPGDVVDVTYSEALVKGVRPVKPGEEAGIKMAEGTLVIDNGVVMKRMQNTLLIRNDAGRMIKVTVDPKFKFLLNGQEATVYDLQEGTKLTRTALRVWDTSYSE